MAADAARPASAKRPAGSRIAATDRGDTKPIVRLSPNHAEADHKPSLGHETERIRVESFFVTHEQFPYPRFAYELKAGFDNATGLRVACRGPRRRLDAH